MLKNFDRITFSDDKAEQYRERKPKYPELEDAQMIYYSQLTVARVAITDETLQNKARYYGTMLAIKDLTYSDGWLSKFKG